MSERRPRVLLVDNDRRDYEVTRSIVRQIAGRGYDLDWEPDPDAALAAIGPGRYDAVLVDYRLERGDGLGLVRDAIAGGYDGPLIVLTGWSSPEVDAAALEVGAADFLDKGELTPGTLDRTLRYTLRQCESERQLRRARAEAEAAGAAKDRFLAILSHELRTPLTPILVAASAVLGWDDLPSALRPVLEMVRRNVELEARLVDDLLDVSRIGRGELALAREAVDVHDAIRQAVDVCREDCLEAELDVRLELDAAGSHADADPTRLAQIFWNLIRNAARYCLPGGALEVASRNLPAVPSGRPTLVVEFRDDGIGLTADQIGRIFDPFERGNHGPAGRASGLGLGLSIAREVAAAHGGSLEASSPGAGRGSTFRLELPTIDPPRTAAPVERAGPTAARALRILLVEDNADTRRYFAMALGSLGHEVLEAASLAAARSLAGAGVDLLLSDIELPDGTGHELMRELGAGGLKGIAMSGFGSEEDIRESHAAGFAEHLTKPLLFGRLAEAIGRHAPRTMSA